MALTREEFAAKATELRENVSDPAKVSLLLSDIIDGYNEQCATVKDLTTKTEGLTKDKENLTKYNMELFLKIPGKMQPNEPNSNKDAPALKYEDLFDSKGRLK